MTFIIYKHTNKINNKVYIGQTSQNLERRWQNGKGYIHSPYFYNAIKKYGWDNFKHEILEEVSSVEEANEREKYWIQYYDSANQNKGYNSRLGGNNSTFNQEIKNKMSQNHADVSGRKNPMYGRRHSKESIQKMKNKHMGLARTEESKQKQSISITGGKNHNAKKIYCIELDMSFDSMADAARYLGYKNNFSGISAYLSGKQKSAGKHPITKEPLHWKLI